MATTRFKGETAGERLDLSGISDSDMIQVRHKPGTIDDADKGISKSQLLSCPFGVSDTSASTGAKVASLTDSNPDFTLVSGREVVVCFTTANSASNPTLNFAGSGAIPIYYPNGQTVGAWPAETWMHLKYFYATVGNSQIQRWILLSPILVDEITANNMNSVTSGAVYERLGTNINWTEVITGVNYQIINKICTITIDLSSGNLNNNGIMNVATLPAPARPSNDIYAPIIIYGYSLANPTYRQTQAYVRIKTDGSITIFSGLTNASVTDCHACITYAR